MIKRKGRGGARPNAGRPRAIKDLSWIELGKECERHQKEDAEQAALEEHKQRPVTTKIREFQKLVRDRRMTNHRQRDFAWGLTELETKPSDWVVSLKIRRVATRAEICARVSDEYTKKWLLPISPRQVSDAWKKYRRLLDEAGHV
jgi:hypothetical protein